MRTYRRVTYDDRCQIFAWMQDNISQTEMARRLRLNKSTISRELKRNSGTKYVPQNAHRLARSRYRLCRRNYLLTPDIKAQIERFIREEWSAVQIAKRFSLEGVTMTSHETIYKYLRQHRKHLKVHLRRLGKTGGGRISQNKRERNANLTKISERPQSINNRSRMGDWERDCMLVKNRRPLIACTDRRSRYTIIAKAKDLKASTIKELTVDLLKTTGRKVLSITNDRGPEFYDPIEGIKVYFCDPQSPQQRGTVENTIGLLRQYFKNSMDIDEISDLYLQEVEEKLNFRPRKCLNYLTPFEVFFNTRVALAS